MEDSWIFAFVPTLFLKNFSQALCYEMRTVSVVPGMPFSILLFLHPDAGENQLGAGLHGG